MEGNNLMGRQKSAAAGFTLIEIMIVLAILGIVAAIAIPSYQSYVENTRRTTAQSDLMELAQWMERRYSENFDYQDGGADPTLPFDVSPRDRDNGNHFYDITFQGNVQADSFTLQAQPVNAQSGDECGTLTLDEEGNRGAAIADCW